MNAKKCDSCEKYFTPWKGYQRTKYIRYIGTRALRLLSLSLDLCVECHNKVRTGSFSLPDKFVVR